MHIPDTLDSQAALGLIAKEELETITRYKQIKDACTCSTCKAIIEEIINDEWRHVGCALHVLRHNPEIQALLDEGDKEAVETAAEFKEKQNSLVGDLTLSE